MFPLILWTWIQWSFWNHCLQNLIRRSIEDSFYHLIVLLSKIHSYFFTWFNFFLFGFVDCTFLTTQGVVAFLGSDFLNWATLLSLLIFDVLLWFALCYNFPGLNLWTPLLCCVWSFSDASLTFILFFACWFCPWFLMMLPVSAQLAR